MDISINKKKITFSLLFGAILTYPIYQFLFIVFDNSILMNGLSGLIGDYVLSFLFGFLLAYLSFSAFSEC